MSHLYVSGDELTEMHRENERANDKLANRIEQLERAIASKVVGEAYRPGTFALREDQEKLDEHVDDLFAVVKTLSRIVGELCVVCEIDPDDFPVMRRMKELQR